MSKWTRLTLVAIIIPVLSGCTSCGAGRVAQPSQDPSPPPVQDPDPGDPPTPDPQPSAERPEFDADRAWADLLRQEAMGPRAPGTAAHDELLAYLVSEMEAHSDRALRQEFTTSTNFGGPYDFANVIGCFAEAKPGASLLVGCHWDCRPVCDLDADPARRTEACPGVNDGGSGVAVLLEIARALKAEPPDFPIYLVFFDAEDSGQTGSGLTDSGFCLGSSEFAARMDDLQIRPSQGIVIDMIGDADLRIPLEQNSARINPALQALVYETAAELGHAGFVAEPGDYVTDDHLPLTRAGVPSIDLIDFDYPSWHTTNDTSENCSRDSLEQVGETLLEVIYEKLPQ